jgi:positive regulator of sigma E activity
MFSALLAAYASPVVALYVSASLPSVASNMEALRLLLALVIGALTPTAVPLSIAYAANKLKG